MLGGESSSVGDKMSLCPGMTGLHGGAGRQKDAGQADIHQEWLLPSSMEALGCYFSTRLGHPQCRKEPSDWLMWFLPHVQDGHAIHVQLGTWVAIFLFVIFLVFYVVYFFYV